jgi:flavodoxin
MKRVLVAYATMAGSTADVAKRGRDPRQVQVDVTAHEVKDLITYGA